MGCKILVIIAVLATANCKDVLEGQNIGGKIIFDEKIEAAPAIWRQEQNVTVNATDNEVISRVVVTDLRPDKDGDAKIVEGGEGHNNVTVELKSPTVLRGYSFHIEVYSVPAEHFTAGKALVDSHNANSKGYQEKTEIKPTEIGNEEGSLRINIREPDVDLPEREAGPSTKAPVSISTDFKVDEEARKVRSAENDKKQEHSKHDSDHKKNPTTGHENATPTTPKNDLKKDDNSKKEEKTHLSYPSEIAHKDVEDSSEEDNKRTEERHARDTKKGIENSTPAVIKEVTDSVNVDAPRNLGDDSIFPKEHEPSSSTTEKGDDIKKYNFGKHVKTTNDASTTSTETVRNARDTDFETKDEVTDRNLKDSTFTHKIPANGRVAVPIDATVSKNEQNLTDVAHRIGLENENSVPNVPIVLAMNSAGSTTTGSPTTKKFDGQNDAKTDLEITTPKIATNFNDKKSSTPLIPSTGHNH